MGKEKIAKKAKRATLRTKYHSRAQAQTGVEAVPINPKIAQAIREILRERGFPEYQKSK